MIGEGAIAQALPVLAVGGLLAYANGANDVSKGIATLVSSGVSDYRSAILWGTGWTAVGGLLGAVFAGAMLATFGSGLLTAGAAPSFAGALAVLLGAAGWVLLASRTGLPVSTTHAIVGSLVGVATVAYGVEAVQWSALGGKVLLPLLVTPLLALGISSIALRLQRRSTAASRAEADCLCAELAPEPVAVAAAGHPQLAFVGGAPQLRVTTGTAEACATAQPAALRLTLNHLHWLTSGATSLARGMNDAPKIVALVLATSVFLPGAGPSTGALFATITFAMVLGSLVAGRRVTQVLAERVTAMDHREGFTVNLVTASLVATGAVTGMPMATTHVSSGGIFGAGLQRGTLNQRTVRDILLAWAITLPASAALGMAAYGVAKLLGGA